ncbi:hypothetical protein B0T10DRAFT_467308 [Thelonectria olida]|uniref:Uncharacterized protein n=1 Tax=Thelonectria olida TaxID=1576542 RepID=A0A9P8VN13_9HYPO|nr:hypothetical protein B0T10DRAFT_467308 [Thelonectria olida]
MAGSRIPWDEFLLFYLCSGLGILILNANALCGVTSEHSSALSWLPMAQFTLEVEVARDGITHVRARILMGLLMKCIGKPSSRHFAIAMEVLVRSYGSQEKWAEDISVVALTLFYLIREHPTRMYFPQIPLMLPKLVLPDEQSLLENYGSAFALSANRYMIYAENFFSVPIQTPLKQLEHIMPYPKCRQESKERVYAYINSQHHRMAIFFGQDITARQQWLDALKSLHLPDRLRIIHEECETLVILAFLCRRGVIDPALWATSAGPTLTFLGHVMTLSHYLEEHYHMVSYCSTMICSPPSLLELGRSERIIGNEIDNENYAQ